MEFLKSLYSDGESMTYEQLSAKAQAQGINAVNAADHVAKGDADNLRNQINTLNGQLAEANKKLAGYDPEWKTKAEAQRKEFDKQRFDFALSKALSTSGARSAKAVSGLLNMDKLTLADDGEIIGLEKQLNDLKAGEDTAFLFGEEKQQSTGMSHQGGTENKLSDKEKANAALRSCFG